MPKYRLVLFRIERGRLIRCTWSVEGGFSLSEVLAEADKYRRLFVYPPNGGLHSVGIEEVPQD